MQPCELCEHNGDVVVSTPKWRVVLVDDAHYPGFCRVIWNKHTKEMTDLSLSERTSLMDVVWKVESIIRDVFQPNKINIASLGNVVPHLHWHVIPRFHDDIHFPNPIWGQVERSVSANLPHRRSLIPLLRDKLKNELEK